MRLKLKNRDLAFFGFGILILGSVLFFNDLQDNEVWLRYTIIVSVFVVLLLQIRVALDYIYPFRIEEKGDNFVINKLFKQYEIPINELEITRLKKVQPGIILRARKFEHALHYSQYGEDEIIGLVSYISMAKK